MSEDIMKVNKSIRPIGLHSKDKTSIKSFKIKVYPLTTHDWRMSLMKREVHQREHKLSKTRYYTPGVRYFKLESLSIKDTNNHICRISRIPCLQKSMRTYLKT